MSNNDLEADGAVSCLGDRSRESADKTVRRSNSNIKSAALDTFEFDAALVYAKEEADIADDILKVLNAIVLPDGSNAKVCLYDEPRFGGSITERPSKVLKDCRFMFVILTNSTEVDSILKFMKTESVGLTLRSTKRRNDVRLLYTQSEDTRQVEELDLIQGLADSVPLYVNDPRAKQEIANLFWHHRQTTEGSEIATGEMRKSGNGRGRKEPQLTPEMIKIRDDSECILTKWQRELFFPTVATRVAMEKLKLKGSVFLTGRSGDGKTATVYYILAALMRIKSSFQPYIISKPEDMDHVPVTNSIVFIDNIFGISNFSSVLLEKWKVRFQVIEASVEKGDMYFIATSPSHVRKVCSTLIENMWLFQGVVDMVDEYSLLADEKAEMLRMYLESKDVHMSSEDQYKAVNSELSLGFPQCCKLFVTNQKTQAHGFKFFERPYIFLNEQIAKLETSQMTSDRVSYQVLVFCAFVKGKFLSDSLNPFSESEHRSLFEKLDGFCTIPNCGVEDRRQAADNLCEMGYFRYSEEEGTYEFAHQSIHDALCVSLANKKYVKEVLELCQLDFLVNNTALLYQKSEKTANIIAIQEKDKDALIKRILSELKNNNFKVLEHSSFCHREFVEEIFENENFVDAIMKILVDYNQALTLLCQKTFYFLTASKKYQTFILKITNTIKTLPEVDKLQSLQNITDDNFEFFERTFVMEVELNSPLDSVKQIHYNLLHQCFEGACSAGDIRLFNNLKEEIKPCNSCFVKAVKCHLDCPYIFRQLVSGVTVTCLNDHHFIRALVRIGKIKSLEAFLDLKRASLSHIYSTSFELYNKACESGSHEMFKKLEELFGRPCCRRELLFAAVKGGSKDILCKLISEDNKNCVDRNGQTLLHHACMKDEGLSELLISKGVDSSVIDKQGRSAFHIACQFMDVTFLKRLIDLNVTVSVTQIEGKQLSPLHMAARNEKGSSMIKLLVQETKNPNMVNCKDQNGSTPLHISAQRTFGHKFIDVLCEHQADQSLKDEEGKTALHCATEVNLPYNIKSLLSHGADVNALDNQRRTPLHCLLSSKLPYQQIRQHSRAQMESISLLLSAGADVRLADKEGNTTLHIAAKNQAPPEVLKQILDNFSGEICLNMEGLSPLHSLMGPCTPITSVELLISKFPSLLKMRTKDGRSVFHVALQKHTPYSIIDAVLEKDDTAAGSVIWDDISLGKVLRIFETEDLISFIAQCATEIPPAVKHTICEHASRCVKEYAKWREAIDQLCLEETYFLDLKCQSLLFSVIDSPKKLKYLTEKGISVNSVDKAERTPLHVAVLLGCKESVMTLLEAQDCRAVQMGDISNATPLMLLLKCDHNNKIFHKALRDNKLEYLYKTIMNAHFHRLMQSDQAHSDRYGVFTAINDRIRQRFEVPSIMMPNQKDVGCMVSILLENNSPINVRDSSGMTALHYSVHDETLLKQLVSAGGDVTLATEDGWTCLHEACLVKNRKTVTYLLDEGLSLYTKDTYGVAPIHVAIMAEMDDDLIQEMYSKCDKSQLEECTWSILHTAAFFSSKEIVEQALDTQILFREDSEGHLPIYYAVASGRLEIVRLISQAMKTAKDRSTDGHRQSGVENEQSDRELLISENAAMSKALQSDISDEEDKHQSLLLPLQKLIETFGQADSQSLLHVASAYGSPPLLKFLIDEGFSVNAEDKNKCTPLHVSVTYGKSDNVECLLEEGAITECLDKNTSTPLMSACSMFPPPFDIISVLVKNGALVQTCNTAKRNSLHLFIDLCNKCGSLLKFKQHTFLLNDTSNIRDNFVKAFKLLIENCVDVNSKDEKGQTPLHIAATADNSFFVEFLLDHGADIDALDSQGRSALQLAVEKKESFPFPLNLQSDLFLVVSAARTLIDRGADLNTLHESLHSRLDFLMIDKDPSKLQKDRHVLPNRKHLSWK